MAVINHCLPTQNGIWVKIYHFWPKNDDAKGSRKMFLKFLHAQTHFQTLLFTPEKEGFGTKMTNSVTKIQKKRNYATRFSGQPVFALCN
jgi:hypothetical protein